MDIDWLIRADKYVFRVVNGKWHNEFLDTVLPFLRSSVFWMPLYLFFVIFILMNFKRGGWFILFAVCTVALTDIISSHIIKTTIFRIRPCRDPELMGLVHFIVPYCPQSSSFTSSHAAIHFGLATFVTVILYPYLKKWMYISYGWAFAIVYAQVYVGIHYPLDVLAGALVGVLAGLLTAWIFKHRVEDFTLYN